MERFVGMEFDVVVEELSQMEGLVDADREYGSVWFSLSEFGWASADVYEFLFEDGVCVGYELDEYHDYDE